MKKAFISALLLLSWLPAFAQNISITESGDDLVYQRGDINMVLPKKDISTTFNDPFLSLIYKYETIFRISDNTIVTAPTNSSMTDLRSKLNAIIATGSGVIPIGTDAEVVSATSSDHWGDSFTAGVGGTSYVTQFATLSGFNAVNDGVGGETSTQVKARFDADPSRRIYSHVFEFGRNDITLSVPVATIKANLAAMIAALGHDRYIVIGVVNRSTEPIGDANYTTITTLNSDWATLYGPRFLDIRAYMLTQGTGTGQDAIDVAAGVTPVSLRATGDNLHYNTAGYAKMAAQVNLKRQYLVGSLALKYVSLGSASLASPSGRTSFNLGINSTVFMGGIPALYVPNQDNFTSSIVFGNGGRLMTHSTGSDGFANTYAGIDAGIASTTANSNSVFGANAGKTFTTQTGLSFFGYGAGQVTVANDNSFFGNQAGIKNTSGTGNAYFGGFTGAASITSSSNSAFGHQAGQNHTSSNNSFFGYRTGRLVAGGGSNSFFGNLAGDAVTSGSKNFAFGNDADLPDPTASNQGNVGNVIWAAGASGTGTTPAGRVGIGINVPAITALLDLTSTSTGVLIPRMTTTQRDAIASPATGLMIMNITVPAVTTLDFFNGTVWKTVLTN